MGAVSEVGEEPVQPMAERRVWWCGGWPHCEKAARMVGWAPAHAQAGFERAEGGVRRGQVLHRTVHVRPSQWASGASIKEKQQPKGSRNLRLSRQSH